MTRVALIGGAFDPTTMGHKALGVLAMTFEGRFDEVWYMPCYSHMFGKDMASPDHRLHMCRESVKYLGPQFKVSDFEILNKLEGSTYDLMCRLRDAYPDHQFTVVIGMDNVKQVPCWRNSGQLVSEFPFLAVGRHGSQLDDKPESQWIRKPPHLIHPHGVGYECSSTLVKQLLRDKQDVGMLVDPSIKQYIADHGLYQ